MKVEFNTTILDQLLYKHTEKSNTIASKFPKIDEWKKEKSQPTIKQLINLANFFNIPFGYFFLEKLPIIKYPVPHYRSGKEENFVPSDELLEMIRTIEERQNWARDLRKDLSEVLPFANSITIDTPIKNATQKIREVLQVSEKWSNHDSIKTWNDAFRFLIRRTEEAGIFVAVNGIVNNNTRKKLKVEEFRGFVLHDNYAPFIFINNNDFVSGKIFTIAHEIAHILIGKSASFENKELLPASVGVEQFCNSVAAEFLVPENILSNEFERVGKDYKSLSNSFRVSQLVIARRLYDLKGITKPEFETAYKSFKTFKSEKTVKATNGGNFYNTATYRIGRSFFDLIYSSARQHKILYRDAFRLTTLTPKSFDGYVKNKLHLKL
jgi:Zn-dependent peptidase ImmA (M78 family)